MMIGTIKVRLQCVHCKKEAVHFRDFLSLKEFTISKLCQECQDKIFKEKEDE
jgi:hypothetical protein